MTVFACLIFIYILAMTGIVPVAMQPPLMFSVLITIIVGGIIGLVGFFKSWDKQAYPIMIVVLAIPLVLIFILYILQG